MVSGGEEVNQFTQIHLIIETKFGGNSKIRSSLNSGRYSPKMLCSIMLVSFALGFCLETFIVV